MKKESTMKKALRCLAGHILASLLACFLASCGDLTGPQGEPGKDGRDAVLPPDIEAVIGAALEAKTGGGDEPWLVRISGLDISDSYTARQVFHGVAAGIPEGGVDLDLSECAGVFFGPITGLSARDRVRYTGLVLPDSLVSINDGSVFANFASLEKVGASGLLQVGQGAFSGCTTLKSLDLPRLAAIGGGAFASTALTAVKLPSVETIGEQAFYQCAIAELELPEVLSIGMNAFACLPASPNTVLETVDLPSAELIGDKAFQYCPRISTIKLPAAQEILGYAFGAYSASPNTVLTSVELPEASIVVAAFQNCTALERAELPVAASIGAGLFDGCAALTTVNAPEATSIGENAFRGCTSLTTLEIPRLRSIGRYSFAGCAALKTLKVPELASVDINAFDGCGLEALELPKVRELGWNAFINCVRLVSLTLGPEVPTSTGNSAANGIFANTRSTDPALAAITIKVPAASLTLYAETDWQQFNPGNTGWINTAANGSTDTWGPNHKEIIMEGY
jgi:hypothetical protein